MTEPREPYRPLTVAAATTPGDPAPGDDRRRDVATVTVTSADGQALTVHVYESLHDRGVLVVDAFGAMAAAGPMTGLRLVVNDEEVAYVAGDDDDQLDDDDDHADPPGP